MQKSFSFFLIVLACWSCSSTKKNLYTFTEDLYRVDPTTPIKAHLSIGMYISYGNYLFEYKLGIKLNRRIHGDTIINEPLNYDIKGIYLLSGKEKKYYEFDTFALKSKLIGQGLFPEKPSGMRLNPVNKTTDSDTYYGLPEPITINGIQCYSADIITKDKTLQDSIQQKVILLKIKHLNSIYSLMGAEFTDNQYCVVAISMYNTKNREGFTQEIKNLRPLTKEEIKICKHMIKASGL